MDEPNMFVFLKLYVWHMNYHRHDLIDILDDSLVTSYMHISVVHFPTILIYWSCHCLMKVSVQFSRGVLPTELSWGLGCLSTAFPYIISILSSISRPDSFDTDSIVIFGVFVFYCIFVILMDILFVCGIVLVPWSSHG